MLLGLRHNRKLFPAIILMWWGAVFSSFAATPVIVDAKPFADGFVMASSDGMLYWTDIDGNPTDSVKLRTDIAGIEVRDGYVLTVSSDCVIMKVERGGKSSRLCNRQITNNADKVVGMACSGKKIFVLTANGTILSSDDDCKSFTALDFNGTYFLYYEQTRFSAISASDNSIFIAGTHDDGTPAVFTSSAGNIWSERTLTYTESGQTLSLEHRPLSMAYDAHMDRFVMGCTDGYLFYLPGCSHCNALERKAETDIRAVAFNGNIFLIR
ncbi:MAG: hypothetical protein IKX55_01935 [Bacteroidaceae bacterium]|nr:hypothetical protein [Bacteroidaceae bacterium]